MHCSSFTTTGLARPETCCKAKPAVTATALQLPGNPAADRILVTRPSQLPGNPPADRKSRRSTEARWPSKVRRQEPSARLHSRTVLSPGQQEKRAGAVLGRAANAAAHISVRQHCTDALDFTPYAHPAVQLCACTHQPGTAELARTHQPQCCIGVRAPTSTHTHLRPRPPAPTSTSIHIHQHPQIHQHPPQHAHMPSPISTTTHRLTRGGGHSLVHGREGHSPDATLVALERQAENQVGQAPHFGGAILAAGADDCGADWGRYRVGWRGIRGALEGQLGTWAPGQAATASAVIASWPASPVTAATPTHTNQQARSRRTRVIGRYRHRVDVLVVGRHSGGDTQLGGRLGIRFHAADVPDLDRWAGGWAGRYCQSEGHAVLHDSSSNF